MSRGKEYLDFVAGWASDNLGHSHPAITQAITEQASTLLQTSNQFYTIPQLRLAQLLVESSALDKVFFCNSGAESVEGALKLAKKYGKRNRDGAYEVITAYNSFHGRTMTTLSATGQPHLSRALRAPDPRLRLRGLRQCGSHHGGHHRPHRCRAPGANTG